MATITREIAVDVAHENLYSAILAKQGDEHSRFLKITVTNQDEPMVIPQTATAIINARRADGEADAFFCTINEDGTITAPLTSWMLGLDDIVNCSISILTQVDEQDIKLTTMTFRIEVQYAEYDGSDISEDPNYDILVTLINEANEAATAASGAASEAGEAATAANNAATAANSAATRANDAADFFGSPLVAATAAAMTATDHVYVYTGNETGYTYGDWYYYNGSVWVSGGIYNSAAVSTDTTLTVSGKAADAKAAGDAITATRNDIAPVETSTASQNFAVGDYLIYNATLYKVTAAIANGETITPGTNVSEDKVSEELLSLENGKLDKNAPVELAEYANQLVSTVGETDTVPYNFRATGGSHEVGDSEKVKDIVGGTLVWNQIIPNGDFSKNGGWDSNIAIDKTAHTGTFTAGNDVGAYKFLTCTGVAAASIVANHVYYVACDITVSRAITKFTFSIGGKQSGNRAVEANTRTRIYTIIKTETVSSPQAFLRFYPNKDGTTQQGDTFVFENWICFDLTRMFGETAANYIQSLWTSNSSACYALITKLFPNKFYAYDAGTLRSVSASAHKMVGFNAFDLAAGTAKLLGRMEYQITGAYTALSYSTGETITPDENGKFTPTLNGVLTVTGGNGTTCVHLVHDGERDGQYEAYSAHTYALDDSVTLRGLPSFDADNNLVYDGDTYASDGTVTRRYGIVDLGQKNWQYVSNYGYFQCTISDMASGTKKSISQKYVNSYASAVSNVGDMEYYTGSTSLRIKDSSFNGDADAFKTSLNGVYFVYELATPTTEAVDPYQETQICSNWGTEEFEDAGVAAGTRDVAIPVGHDTVYLPNLRAKLEAAPDSPDADGVYLMKRENGVNSYVQYLGELPTDPSEDGTYSLVCTVADGTATISWTSNS